jgi:hypothetical protein
MSQPPFTPHEQVVHQQRVQEEIQKRIEELSLQYQQLMRETGLISGLRPLEARGVGQEGNATPSLGSAVPGWLAPILQGFTLLAIISCAYWLGTLSSTVSHNSTKLDTVYQAVLASKDGLSSRTSAIEAKLEGIDKKLDHLVASSPKR